MFEPGAAGKAASPAYTTHSAPRARIPGRVSSALVAGRVRGRAVAGPIVASTAVAATLVLVALVLRRGLLRWRGVEARVVSLVGAGAAVRLRLLLGLRARRAGGTGRSGGRVLAVERRPRHGCGGRREVVAAVAVGHAHVVVPDLRREGRSRHRDPVHAGHRDRRVRVADPG